MLQDLDNLMMKNGLEAIIIEGESTFLNPEFYFVIRKHIARGGIYLKKVYDDPLLLVSDIDKESAKKSVIRRIMTYSEKGFDKILQSQGFQGSVNILTKLLHEEGISGRIGIFGRINANRNTYIVKNLTRKGYRIDSSNFSVLQQAMATKSRDEIASLKRNGELCEKTISQIIDLLRHSDLSGNKFTYQGKEVTTKLLRNIINHLFAEYNLIPDHGYILTTGSKTADPHYLETETVSIKRGKPILIDIYPRGPNNLYFDLTRTFVIGRATKKIKDMYQTILEAHDAAIDLIDVGKSTGEIMNSICNIIEKKGYHTLRRKRKINEHTGFIHSLGHGVGWTLSDKPLISLSNTERFKTGNVITIEPGLYNPKIGGVRLENVIAINKRGIIRLSQEKIPFEI